MKRRSTTIFLYGILFLFCILFAVLYYGNHQEDTYNKARILLKTELDELTNGEFKQTEHPYFTFDLNGIVTHSYTEGYLVGKKINVTEELQTDHAFLEHNSGKWKTVFPLKQEEKINGFVVFLLEKDEIHTDSAIRILLGGIPFFLWSIAVLTCLIVWNRCDQKRIMKPIQQITESATAIIDGDYSKEIVQYHVRTGSEDEMERLIYSFEMMRDELKSNALREERLKQSQKELLSCMSHDLRTPITTIKAHAEAMRDGIVKTEEKKTEYLETIIRKSDTLNRMISDLLDHSNADLNQLKIVRTDVYLKEFLDGLKGELSTYCLKWDCNFLYENEVPELLVSMDSTRITQVIYNLVENACKYSYSPTKTPNCEEVSTVRLICGLNKDEKRVSVTVADNGPGIAMSDIPFIFDRFYRAEKSRSMQIPGAGLGLAICKYIIEEHGGEIAIRSRSHEGTQVIFYLGY